MIEKIAGIKLSPCENPECRFSKMARHIPKSRLIVDRMGTVFMMPTFVCECSYHLRSELIKERG